MLFPVSYRTPKPSRNAPPLSKKKTKTAPRQAVGLERQVRSDTWYSLDNFKSIRPW